jgi:hypothetical protein
VVITGQFSGDMSVPTGTPATVITATGTGFDVFTIKVSTLLAPAWAQRLGGTAADDARGVAVDSLGQVFVTGVFAATATNTWGGANLVTAGGNDSFVLRLDPTTGIASYAANFGDGLGQDGLTIVASRYATNAEKDSVWTKGNFAGQITFPGQPILGTAGNTTPQKYFVKFK